MGLVSRRSSSINSMVSNLYNLSLNSVKFFSFTAFVKISTFFIVCYYPIYSNIPASHVFPPLKYSRLPLKHLVPDLFKYGGCVVMKLEGTSWMNQELTKRLFEQGYCFSNVYPKTVASLGWFQMPHQ